MQIRPSCAHDVRIHNIKQATSWGRAVQRFRAYIRVRGGMMFAGVFDAPADVDRRDLWRFVK